jgi:hypothetical protein
MEPSGARFLADQPGGRDRGSWDCVDRTVAATAVVAISTTVTSIAS